MTTVWIGSWGCPYLRQQVPCQDCRKGWFPHESPVCLFHRRHLRTKWSKISNATISFLLTWNLTVPTPSTSSVSTRCCPVPVRIDSKPVCVVPGVSPTALSPVSTLDRSFSPSVPVTHTALPLLRLWGDLSTSMPSLYISPRASHKQKY